MWWRGAGVSRAVATAVVAEVVVLLYGTGAHLGQLLERWPPYPWAPGWLATYFVLLTFLDPLAAGLLLMRRRPGLVLASVVLVTDAAANWYASYVLPYGTARSKIAQAVISVLAVGSLVVARRLWPGEPSNIGRRS